jgi:hypothetical protein
MCGKVDTVLEQGHASAQKMTLHDDQDKELAEMRTRYALTLHDDQDKELAEMRARYALARAGSSHE